MIITSTNNEKIKYIRKLKNIKNSINEKKFVIEGENLVKEALNCNILLETFSLSDTNYGVANTIISDNVMKSLTNLNSIPNVIGIASIKDTQKELSDRIILLDNIQDPGNLGTIIRSSFAFGFSTIILGNGCVNKFNDKVIRSSEGMIFKCNIFNEDLLSIIPKLKKLGYDVYGTNVRNGVDVKNINLTSRVAFVIGNEGNGISKEVDELLDKNLYIKMNKNCESLNASVAASIIMYELSR